MMPPTQQLRDALLLANAAAVADIEANPCERDEAGQRWYDTRPMVDPREHAPEVVDMATMALRYALDAGLVRAHPARPHLVRVLQREA